MARTCFRTELCQGNAIFCSAFFAKFLWSYSRPKLRNNAKIFFAKGEMFLSSGKPKTRLPYRIPHQTFAEMQQRGRGEKMNTRLSRVSFRAKSRESNLKPSHISHSGSLSFMRETVFPKEHSENEMNSRIRHPLKDFAQRKFWVLFATLNFLVYHSDNVTPLLAEKVKPSSLFVNFRAIFCLLLVSFPLAISSDFRVLPKYSSSHWKEREVHFGVLTTRCTVIITA